MKWKKWLIISIAISAASLAIIFMMTVSKQGIAYLLQVSPVFIALALLAHIMQWIFWSLRIKVMAHALGTHVSMKTAFRIVMVNLFMASVTPSSFGGEPARIKMLSEEDMSGGDATAVTLSERLIEFIFFGTALPVLLLLLGMAIDIEGIKYYLIGAALLLIGAGAFVIYMVKNAEKFSKKMHKLEFLVKYFVKDERQRKDIVNKMESEFLNFAKSTVVLMKSKKLHFIAAFGCTAGLWISEFSVASFILMAMGHDPMWLFSLTVQMIILLVSILPVSPGGSGISEFTAYFLYTQQLPSSTVGALVILWRLLTFYANLIVGLIYTLGYLAKK